MDAGSALTGAPAPTSVQEVEQLVQRFYQPGNSAEIAALDVQLKQLQTSQDGWQLADALFGSQDERVRFFAALTFQVKLRADGAKLDAATAESVLLRLIDWTVRLDRGERATLVNSKLCAALATFYARSSILWERPIFQLVVSFHQGRAIAGDDLPSDEEALVRLASLSESQLLFILTFSASLAVEMARTDSNSPAGAALLNQMRSISGEAVALIKRALATPHSLEIVGGALSSFNSWVDYAHSNFNRDDDSISRLRTLIPELVPCLYNDALEADALETFREILDGSPGFVCEPYIGMLLLFIEERLTPRILQGLQDSDSDILPMVQFVAIWAVANVEAIVERPDTTPGARSVVQLLIAVLNAPGYVGQDDEASEGSHEWWNTYLEHAGDRKGSEPGEAIASWLPRAVEVCFEVVATLCRKLSYPPSDVLESWSPEDLSSFDVFRRDAVQMVSSIYTILDQQLLVHYNQIIGTSLANKNWEALEVALFCVNSLTDYVDAEDESLAQIFQSDLFRQVADPNQSIPIRVCRTAVKTLSSFSTTVSRNINYVPDTIRFLVASLDDAALVDVGAKAMHQLCSACRKDLTGEVDGFIDQYRRLRVSPFWSHYASKEFISAIAVIIQAITPETAQLKPLTALLDIIDDVVTAAEVANQQGDEPQASTYGDWAVTYLACIGKSLQDPTSETVVIDLEQPTAATGTSLWLAVEGQAIQNRILQSSLKILRLFSDSEDVVKHVCEVFKSGLMEESSGPFVFSPHLTVQFIEEFPRTTADITSVVSLAQSMINVLPEKGEPGSVEPLAQRLQNKLIDIIVHLNNPTSDPNLSHACLEAFKRLLITFPAILLDLSSPAGDRLKPILDFALAASDCTEPFPKRSSAAFWTELIHRGTPTGNPDPTDQAARARAFEAITAYGPGLVHRYVNLITGAAQRSELQHVCEPLRALLGARVETRGWIEAVLLRGQLSTRIDHISEADRRRFVALLAASQGSARTFRVQVVDIYAVCRGTVVKFSSGR